jgi:hypothetical protein
LNLTPATVTNAWAFSTSVVAFIFNELEISNEHSRQSPCRCSERPVFSRRRRGRRLERSKSAPERAQYLSVPILELAGPFRMANGAYLSNSAVNPDGIRGATPSLTPLQAGHGAPDAPQPQAPSPSQGRSEWRSHTRPLSLQKSHFMCVATGRLGREPRERAADVSQRPSFSIRNFT